MLLPASRGSHMFTEGFGRPGDTAAGGWVDGWALSHLPPARAGGGQRARAAWVPGEHSHSTRLSCLPCPAPGGGTWQGRTPCSSHSPASFPPGGPWGGGPQGASSSRGAGGCSPGAGPCQPCGKGASWVPAPSSARSHSNCRAAPPGGPVCRVIHAPAHACAHERARTGAGTRSTARVPTRERAPARCRHPPAGPCSGGAGFIHHPEIWQPEELANETGWLPKPWLGLLSRPWLLLPGAISLERRAWPGRRGAPRCVRTSLCPHCPGTVARRPRQVTPGGVARGSGLPSAKVKGVSQLPRAAGGACGGSGAAPPAGLLFGLPDTPSDVWALPPTHGGGRGQRWPGSCRGPPGPTQRRGGARCRQCLWQGCAEPSQPPSAPVALGGRAPAGALPGRGKGPAEGPGGPKKASINYSSGEVK